MNDPKKSPVPETPEQFNKRAEELRRREKWSKSKLAKRLGVGERTLYKYQDGSITPSPNSIQRLLDLMEDPDAPLPAEAGAQNLLDQVNERFNRIENQNFELAKQLAELRGMLMALRGKP